MPSKMSTPSCAVISLCKKMLMFTETDYVNDIDFFDRNTKESVKKPFFPELRPRAKINAHE